MNRERETEKQRNRETQKDGEGKGKKKWNLRVIGYVALTPPPSSPMKYRGIVGIITVVGVERSVPPIRVVFRTRWMVT